MARYKNDECIASRTVSFPRKEKDTLLTPPETQAYGRFFRIQLVALKKSSAFFRCSSNPVATGKIFGSKMISCGGKWTMFTNILYERSQISIRRSYVSA